jgi:peptidyl-prolyl cis-trans isomerase C
VPALEEVEPEVKSAWLDQKQREFKRTAFDRMRARYTVVIPPVEAVDFGSLRTPIAPTPSTGVVPE